MVDMWYSNLLNFKLLQSDTLQLIVWKVALSSEEIYIKLVHVP